MKLSIRQLIIPLLLIFCTAMPPAGAGQPLAASAQHPVELMKIQNYLNGIRTLQADFVQNNPNGSQSGGRMYLKRLGKESFGKLRLDYAPPSPLTIIANGEVLRQEDRDTGEMSEYAIDSTPASFLLRHKIDFSDGLEVKQWELKGNRIHLTLVRAEDDSVTLTLVFITSPLLRLQEWTVIDAQANKTHVALSKVEIGIPLNDKLFNF